MNQISIFDFLDESAYMTPNEKIFNSIIEEGSNVEDSLCRIKKNIDLPMNEFITFLKKEFGTGGSCYKGYCTWWDAKGVKVGEEFDKMVLHPWLEVARAFKKRYGSEQII